MLPELQPLLTGLIFGESTRWHDNRLWCIDMGAHEVIGMELDGNRQVVVSVPAGLSAIDWLHDGRMLIAPFTGERLLRQEPDGSLETHADLTSLSVYPWNDMAVDGRGNAYIGNLGFHPSGGEFRPGTLGLVSLDGSCRQVADE